MAAMSEAPSRKKTKGFSRLLARLLGRPSGNRIAVQQEPSLRPANARSSGSEAAFAFDGLSQYQACRRAGSQDFPVRSHASMPLLVGPGRSGLPQISVSGSPSNQMGPALSSSATALPQLPPLYAWSNSVTDSPFVAAALPQGPPRPFGTISAPDFEPSYSVAAPLSPPLRRIAEAAEPLSPAIPTATASSLQAAASAPLRPHRGSRSIDIPIAASSPALTNAASSVAVGALSCALSTPADLGPAPSAPPQRVLSALAPPPLAEMTRRAQSQPQLIFPLPSAPEPEPAPPAPEPEAAPGGSQLLSLGSCVPPSMRRPAWRLADYTISGRIYRGDMSSVFKAACIHSGIKVVLKVYNLKRVPDNTLHMLVREIKIHSDLAHDSILKLYGVFEESERLVLVLERASRGDLFSLHRGLPGYRMGEEQLRQVVLVPLLEALAHLHARGVCHRDIKPENILFTSDWRLRLADFGAAIDMSLERAVTRTGTVHYMAPEVVRCPLKRLPEENKDVPGLAYTTAADVWSVGVLAFEMLVGFPPFIRLDCGTRVAATAPGRDRASGSNGGCAVSFPHFVSACGRDFISLALAERPAERPTAAELLRHPWLKHARRASRAERAAATAGAPPPPPQQQQQMLPPV